jgi:hypothetical protein
VGCASFDDHEGQEQQGGDREPDDGLGGGPAQLGRLDDGPGEAAQHQHRQRESDAVDPRHTGVTRLRHDDVRRDGGDEGQRDQRPEDAAPVELLQERAPDDRPGGDADADDGTPDAQCGDPLTDPRRDEGLGDVTRAPAALARAKPTRPRTSAGRRPYRSERLPIASTSAAKARL